MVSVTEFIQSIDIDILKTLGWILNNSLVYGLLITGLIFIAGKKRRMKIFAAVLLALAIGMALKQGFAIERPCAGESWCPEDYSFPSNHAVAAFTLMIAFLKRREFPYLLLFALFIAFTRINIGVHTFYDIEAALPVAFISYYITRTVIKNGE
ncbi:phosphatase PAP2 family protein [Candidatus Micrarchaeota archaeon]|nr:phosphatase PAP2 family protein [Candidatus Micrarchaeota archaeon]